MKYTVYEDVKIYSACYSVFWQVKKDEEVIKQFCRKENAQTFCNSLNVRNDLDKALEDTYKEASNRFKKLGLNDSQTKRAVEKSEPWIFGWIGK